MARLRNLATGCGLENSHCMKPTSFNLLHNRLKDKLPAGLRGPSEAVRLSREILRHLAAEDDRMQWRPSCTIADKRQHC